MGLAPLTPAAAKVTTMVLAVAGILTGAFVALLVAVWAAPPVRVAATVGVAVDAGVAIALLRETNFPFDSYGKAVSNSGAPEPITPIAPVGRNRREPSYLRVNLLGDVERQSTQ